ncbi:MAG: FecR domain-containing protein [Methyloceanibacter sp.]
MTWPSLGGTLLLALLAFQSASSAERVGVAAAVKPEATSQPPGGDTSTLKIGKSVVYNERINTSGSGVVQVLLLDGSTFTVGPGSSLIIDKFVYNPSSGTGELVASFSKGALRFVGGKLSKNEPGVKVKTPAGSLTVRGGIALIAVEGPNRAAAALVFGNYLALVRGGKRDVLKPGNMFVISGPGQAVKRASNGADMSALFAAISGQKTKLAGKTPKGKPWPRYYGIQPSGTYPDEPFVKELYYNNAATQLILGGATRVPQRVPPPPPPPPPQPDLRPPVIGGPCVANRC